MCQKITRANRVSPYCNLLQTASNTIECAFQKIVSNTNLRCNKFITLFLILSTINAFFEGLFLIQIFSLQQFCKTVFFYFKHTGLCDLSDYVPKNLTS